VLADCSTTAPQPSERQGRQVTISHYVRVGFRVGFRVTERMRHWHTLRRKLCYWRLINSNNLRHQWTCIRSRQCHSGFFFCRRHQDTQETELSLTNRATRLEVSQGHQTIVPFHMLRMDSYYCAIVTLSVRCTVF